MNFIFYHSKVSRNWWYSLKFSENRHVILVIKHIFTWLNKLDFVKYLNHFWYHIRFCSIISLIKNISTMIKYMFHLFIIKIIDELAIFNRIISLWSFFLFFLFISFFIFRYFFNSCIYILELRLCINKHIFAIFIYFWLNHNNIFEIIWFPIVFWFRFGF